MRRAQPPTYVDRGLGIKAEHICLESDERVVPHGSLPVIRFGPKFRFELPAGQVEFTFSTDHRLTVLLRRPRDPVRKYVLDLRFVDPVAAFGRRVAWRWLQLAAALACVGAIGLWLPAAFPEPRWPQAMLPAAAAFVMVALCVTVVALLRTRDVVELRSAHGAAHLAGITGRLGSARASDSFVAALASAVETARAQFSQSKQQFLRDEMREHHRLWKEGVLSDAVYEASKRRILQAHDEKAADRK